MSEKPPPRPPARAPAGGNPPPLPRQPKTAPGGTAEATAPKKSAPPPPLPTKGKVNSSDDDGGATKLFSGNLGDECELVVVQGEFQGRTIKLGAGTVVIGRSSECDLVLKAASGVSRRHCKVQYLGNRFVVIDLESRNGTIVNGQSVERKVLENGDKIEVGDELLQFVVHSMADLRAPAASDDDAAIENLPTQQLPQAVSLPPAPPIAPTRKPAPEPLPETLPPQRYEPPPAPVDVAPSFAPVELPPVAPPTPPAKERSSAGFYVFGLVAVVVLGGAAFLAWDVFFRDDHDVVAAADAGAVVTADAGSVVAAAVVDAGSAVVDAGAVAVAVVDAGAVVVDAGVAVVAAPAVVDAGVVATTPTTPPTTPPVEGKFEIVRANVGGKAEKVLVNVGDVVTAETPVMVVAGENFNLKKKLETLRGEAAELEPYVGKVPSAKADLDSVRAEMKRIEGRLKPQTLKANKAGTVLEVLVKPGDVVRDGAPILKLNPG